MSGATFTAVPLRINSNVPVEQQLNAQLVFPIPLRLLLLVVVVDPHLKNCF